MNGLITCLFALHAAGSLSHLYTLGLSKTLACCIADFDMEVYVQALGASYSRLELILRENRTWKSYSGKIVHGK